MHLANKIKFIKQVKCTRAIHNVAIQSFSHVIQKHLFLLLSYCLCRCG